MKLSSRNDTSLCQSLKFNQPSMFNAHAISRLFNDVVLFVSNNVRITQFLVVAIDIVRLLGSRTSVFAKKNSLFCGKKMKDDSFAADKNGAA